MQQKGGRTGGEDAVLKSEKEKLAGKKRLSPLCTHFGECYGSGWVETESGPVAVSQLASYSAQHSEPNWESTQHAPPCLQELRRIVTNVVGDHLAPATKRRRLNSWQLRVNNGDVVEDLNPTSPRGGKQRRVPAL